MKEIFVKDIIAKCNGKLVIGNENDLCENFEKDTREIKKNDVFIGIKGENFDGNKFYEKALENGAKTCILQGVDITEDVLNKYSDRNIILVDDTIIALGEIAKYKRSLFDIPVVGITGSVGKTSTKDIIANVVAQKYNVLKTEGNMNNDIGLPLTILNLRKEHQALVVEMGMNHKGEIAYLTNIAKPTIAIVTNIGTSHIGNLGSRENILKAKLEILEGLNNKGVFIYNNDNDMLYNNKKAFENYKTLNYGIENISDIMASNIVTNINGSKFDIKIDKEIENNIYIKVSGRHFVYNSLCAIAVGNILNIPIDDTKNGIETFSLTKNRMEVNEFKPNITVINDSYNASYDSMKVALEFLGSFKDKYRIAVLGDMLELGEFSDELHFNVGKSVYANNIDVLITVGHNSKKIAEGAYIMGMSKENIYTLENNDEAFKILTDHLNSNSAILLKASNSMNFSYMYNKLLEKLK